MPAHVNLPARNRWISWVY